MEQNRDAVASALMEEVQAIEDVVTISRKARRTNRLVRLRFMAGSLIGFLKRKNQRTGACFCSDSVKSQLFGMAGHNPYGV